MKTGSKVIRVEKRVADGVEVEVKVYAEGKRPRPRPMIKIQADQLGHARSKSRRKRTRSKAAGETYAAVLRPAMVAQNAEKLAAFKDLTREFDPEEF